MRSAVQDAQRRINLALVYVTSLFFAWGFVTATIDPLIPSVRSIFSLSYAESMLTQFAFFLAYGVVSLPAGMLVARKGYARSILYALGAMIAGCLLIPVATTLRNYEFVLVALFVIASGITLLQVAANPLAAVLGAPERSHFRLTLSQAFNSLGTVLAPFIGSVLMLRGGVFGENGAADLEASRTESLRNIDTSFVIIALAIAALAFFIWRVRRSISAAAPEHLEYVSPLQAFRSRWAVLGAVAIFLYVGAEVSIGSIMINFLEQPSVLAVSAETAGRLLSLYWLGAMVGRFIGSALLIRVPAGRLLTVAALAAGLLCLIVSQSSGVTAAGAAIAVGLFNSIMFPTIFTLTLERSNAPVASTSGLLCMAIVGGALLPVLAGHVADIASIALAFLVPMAAYVGIALFAAAAAKVRVSSALAAPSAH
jgi:FHS family L-fucose permease-like MFS transporter